MVSVGLSLVALLLMLAVTSGCGTIGTTAATHETHPPPTANGQRKLAVFLDGTSNDDLSGTNVSSLFELVQARPELGAFYVEGVGAQGKPIGMALSWGIGHRVRLAYSYLARHHRRGDQVYIFGFSRGAYSARILASMLYHVGLPDAPDGRVAQAALIDELYDAFKGDKASLQRASAARDVTRRHGLPDFNQVDVQLMGLWDTVEALGLPNYVEDENVPNPRYGDQLCNVEHAYHALSLDDNRAQIFTPILLTRTHLLADCQRETSAPEPDVESLKRQVNEKVEEVYFPGAHADVGGGYENGQLRFISLRWMLSKAAAAGIFQTQTPLPPANVHAPSHDAQGGFPWNFIYRRLYRSIDRYAEHPQSVRADLLFHQSIIDRLSSPERNSFDFEYGGRDRKAQETIQQSGDTGRLASCFSTRMAGSVKVYDLPDSPSTACRLKVVRYDGRIVEAARTNLTPEEPR